MNDKYAVLSALVDGQDVDPSELEAALDAPDGRQALVAFVRLRQVVRSEDQQPRAEFYTRVQSQLSPPNRRIWTGVPWPFAAAAALVAALAGSLLDSGGLNERRQPDPPEAARILTFEPGIDWQQ